MKNKDKKTTNPCCAKDNPVNSFYEVGVKMVVAGIALSYIAILVFVGIFLVSLIF